MNDDGSLSVVVEGTATPRLWFSALHYPMYSFSKIKQFASCKEFLVFHNSLLHQIAVTLSFSENSDPYLYVVLYASF